MKAYNSTKQQYPKWYLAYARAMAANYPDLTVADRIKELYKRLSWVATAIDVVAIIASSAGKSIKKITGDEDEDVPNHDFENVLLNPNPIQSGRSFIFSLVADYKLHNKAYIWLNVVNNKPIELWRIPTTQIAPRTDGNLGISYFDYDPGAGNKIQIPVEQIMYWKGYDPDNIIYPDSALMAVSLAAQSDLKMQSWNQNVYDGNGRLPGVMTFADMIPDPQWEQIGEDIDEAANKQNILRLRGTGSGAIGWIQTSSPPKDMEFYVGRQNNRDEIWNRLAPGLVSMLSENSTEANSRTGKATIIDLVVYPVLQMLYETMTAQIVWRYYGTDLKIEPDDIRVTDRVLLLQETSEFSKTATVNEVRTKKWKLNELTDERGDMLVAEAQTYKTEKPEPQPVPAQFGNNNPFGNNQNEKVPPDQSNEQREAEAEEEKISAKAIIKDPRPTLLELEKWERLATRKGASVEFVCYNTPRVMAENIRAELVGCANHAAIKAVFDNVRDELMEQQTESVYEPDDLKKLAESINMAAQAVKTEKVNEPMQIIVDTQGNVLSSQESNSEKILEAIKALVQMAVTKEMPVIPAPQITFSPMIVPSEVAIENKVEVQPAKVENKVTLEKRNRKAVLTHKPNGDIEIEEKG